MSLESLPYLLTQTARMNTEQLVLVQTLQDLSEKGNSPTKTDEERATQLYLWLHMDSGSVQHRHFRDAARFTARKPKAKGEAKRPANVTHISARRAG